MKTITFNLKSTVPLLMHKDRTANPFDQISKEMKKISSKRNKTEEDLLELAKIEFAASCYYRGNENPLYEPSVKGMVNGWYMPASNLLSTLENAAKNFKLGKRFKQSVNILTDSKFNFSDSKLSPFELFELGSYSDMRTVKVQQSKLIRCRPIFSEWELTFELFYEETMLNDEDIMKIMEFASRFIGLCDYRPRFGQFEFKRLN